MTKLEKVLEGQRCCNYPEGSGDCKDCPYNGNPNGCNDLHRDTLELLKAHAPRVMTLDEVANLEEHQFVWVEINNSDEPIYCLEIVRFRGLLCVNLEITLDAFRDIVIVYTKNYNKEYRFWTNRPTDEQRKAVKWE